MRKCRVSVCCQRGNPPTWRKVQRSEMKGPVLPDTTAQRPCVVCGGVRVRAACVGRNSVSKAECSFCRDTHTHTHAPKSVTSLQTTAGKKRNQNLWTLPYLQTRTDGKFWALQCIAGDI